jgi:hypothetical protein
MSVRKVFESQAFLIIANVLSGIISLAVIGLTADNLAYVHTPAARNDVTSIHYNTTISENIVLQQASIAVLPQDLRLGSYWLLLAAGIGGFLDSLLLGGMLCWRRLKAAELQVENPSIVRTFVNQCNRRSVVLTRHRPQIVISNRKRLSLFSLPL